MSAYYITAIRYSADGSHISDVLVHTPGSDSGRLSKGVIKSKNQVIYSMNQNDTFKTAIHNYSTGKWTNGAEVGVVRIGYTDYLRTDRDKSAKDNLGNLLLIDELR